MNLMKKNKQIKIENKNKEKKPKEKKYQITKAISHNKGIEYGE